MNATNKNDRKVEIERSWRTSNLRKLPGDARQRRVRSRAPSASLDLDPVLVDHVPVRLGPSLAILHVPPEQRVYKVDRRLRLVVPPGTIRIPVAVETLDEGMKLSRYAQPAVFVMNPGTNMLAIFPIRLVDGGNSDARMGRKGRRSSVRSRGSICASCGEHVEGDGGGPGLFSGAERLAGERLEVLCEAPL